MGSEVNQANSPRPDPGGAIESNDMDTSQA